MLHHSSHHKFDNYDVRVDENKINKVKVNKMGLNFLFLVRSDSSSPLFVIITPLQTKNHCIIMFFFIIIISLSLLLCLTVCVLNVIEIVCVLCFVFVERKITFCEVIWKNHFHTHTHNYQWKFPNKSRMRIICCYQTTKCGIVFVF